MTSRACARGAWLPAQGFPGQNQLSFHGASAGAPSNCPGLYGGFEGEHLANIGFKGGVDPFELVQGEAGDG